MQLEQYFQDTGNTWISEDLFKKNHITDKKVVRREKDNVMYLTTPAISFCEAEIAVRVIDKLLEEHKTYSKPEIDYYIDWYETVSGFKLAYEQRQAVHMAMNNSISVLTGGPGTGKTCVLRAVDFISTQLGHKNIMYCAPTGKAARRITESTGRNARTTQKAMGYSPNSDSLKRLFANLIINDEVSIMDMETMDNFMKAVGKGTHLLFVGDVEQLPSVGPGAILRDLIDSKVIPVTKLEETFRQASDSGIMENILRIKRGRGDLIEMDDFHFLECSSKQAQEKIIEEYLKDVDKYGSDNVVCLTPYRRKGKISSNTLNQILQKLLNPIGSKPFLRTEVIESGETEKRKVIFQVGDPVMQLENRTECANGDVGKIISASERGVCVEYVDGKVFYPIPELGQITLAYAMSVHKSQGSEYACVISPVLPEHIDMLNRNMLYTAVTRAKKECILIGDKELVPKALETEAGYERITFLAEEIYLEYKKRILLKHLKKVS